MPPRRRSLDPRPHPCSAWRSSAARIGANALGRPAGIQPQAPRWPRAPVSNPAGATPLLQPRPRAPYQPRPWPHPRAGGVSKRGRLKTALAASLAANTRPTWRARSAAAAPLAGSVVWRVPLSGLSGEVVTPLDGCIPLRLPLPIAPVPKPAHRRRRPEARADPEPHRPRKPEHCRSPPPGRLTAWAWPTPSGNVSRET